MNSTHISIITPAYNRAHTLPRLFESIEQQTYPCHEVIVVDDGSSDDTQSLVEAWASRVEFPVRYIFQHNSGRHVAHNTGVLAARGELIFPVDSDDWLPVDSLAIIADAWESIPQAQRADFAGIEGLCAFADGKVSGTLYPEDVFDSDYIRTRYDQGVYGDRKSALRADLLKKYLYPVFEGEKHIRDSFIWKEIALHYRTRYLNKTLQFIEYQADGLSANPFKMRTGNPQGFAHYFYHDVTRFQKKSRFSVRHDSMVKYIRYSFLAGRGIRAQLKQVGGIMWCLALPLGWLKYRRDCYKLNKKAA